MPPLVLYFNELSLPPSSETSDELKKWCHWASLMVVGLTVVGEAEPDYTFAFPRGTWHAVYQDRPFSCWIKEGMKHDQYARLLSRIRQIDVPDDLLRHVYFNHLATVGFTYAYISESWAVSFPIEDSPWLAPVISAIEYRQEGDNIVSGKCEIMHIANEEHASGWRPKLVDWGRVVAENNTVGILLGYHLEMYPFDHGYPHIHLVDSNLNKTFAKYRVDKFVRIEGKPKWDPEVRGWIERNRDELMRAWTRCQKGEHPYRIGEA